MKVTDAAAMHSVMGSEHQKSYSYGPSAPYALWPVDLKISHLDWNPEATLIHFQGQYLTICELDYNILQGEIQNIPKTKAAVDIGEFCLVEDLTSARWYRGRVQNRKEDLFDVFLIDHGNVLSVDIANISSCSNELFILPPKIVCGFLANVMLLQSCPHSVVEEYFSNLVGRNITGYIQALLPHKVLLLETPDINTELVRHGFGRHVDTATFLLLVEMLTEVPLKHNIEPVPDLLIEKPRELCFKMPGLQGYEDILSFCGPRLSCGTRAKVRITAAVHPGLFYCQMVSMETDLREMSNKLATICEHRAKERKQNTPENLGLLCAVQGKDWKWYRGFVQFLPVNSQVRVLFIDYGFFESVKLENVYRLPPAFDSTPIMAFPCSLFSLGDPDEAVRAQQLSFLKEGLLGKVLDVVIRSFNEQQHLYSVMVVGAEDNHVMEQEPIIEFPKIKVESIFETEELSQHGGYFYHETIMCEALGRTLEAEEVQVGSVFVGYAEHVRNPNHFWVRTQNRSDDFEEMMTKMADHFSQVKLDQDVLLNPELGTLCCALYEKDMHFYRGVVTDILEHGAEVFFIDFGNIEKVPHMLIKKIPKTFASKSPFAFCCSLVNVLPSDEVWTSTNSDFFRRAVVNKALLVHVVQMRRNKFVVDLHEMGSDCRLSMTELLISSKQAEYWNNIRMELNVQNITDVTEKPRCPGYTITPDINGNTKQLEDWGGEEKQCKNETENTQVPTCFKAISAKPGCEFAVCCSYINSPSDFWCQPLQNIPALEALMDKIQLYYSTHTVTLQPGDSCCVAKSPEDGRWHRALITEKERGHVKVMLIDYGCTFQIEEQDLQAIIPEHSYLEGQALRCSLYNLIESADPENCENWSLEVCNKLKDFVRDSTCGLRCKVVSQLNVKNKGLCNVVDLYNTQTQQSIRNLLLEQGLAREPTVATKQMSTVFPESFVFSLYDLSLGNEEQVYVTHVSSQLEVYCHLERNADIIEELEKKISEQSEKMMKASTRAVVRKLCLAKYLDGNWYRGVAHPVQSPLHFSVFFVDYGNTDITEKTNVMFIPRDSTDLLYTPMQAVRCSLASVSKEDLCAHAKEWLDGAVLNKQVRAIIVGNREDGSFEVELFDGEISINEKVKELILSLSPKPKTVVSFDISRTNTKLKNRYIRNPNSKVNCKNQCDGQSSNSPTSVAHRVGCTPHVKKENNQNNVDNKAKSERKVKEQSEDNAKDCFPVKPQKNPKEKHDGNTHNTMVGENCDTNTESEERQYTEKTEIPQSSCLPEIHVTDGFRAKCFVSHMDSINSFFLQLSEDEPALLKIGEDLNSYVSRDSLKTATSLRVNDLVVAEYEEDGALYRSAVRGFEGSSCFKVEFVDYGNSAVVGREKIYSIPKEYLSQPRLCISCSLLDSNTYKNDTSFHDAVMDKPLMVDFVHQNGNHWKVKVEILNESSGLPAPLEAMLESSDETEKDNTVPLSSPETEDTERTCEENYMKTEIHENETNMPKRITPTPSKFIVEPPPVPGLTKLKVKSCGYYRTLTGIKSSSKRSQRRTMKSCVKAKSDCAGRIIPPAIQAKDTEDCTVLSVLSNSNFYVRLNRTNELLSALENHIADNIHKCEVVADKDVKPGLKCLVQVHSDKQWHRAVVKHVWQEKFKVLLIDHGKKEAIESCSIRQLCSDLREMPNFAVLCKVNCFGFSEGKGSHKFWCETLKPMIGKEVKLMFVCYSRANKLWKVEVIVNGLFLIRQITTSLQHNEEVMPSPTETQNEQGEGKASLNTIQPQQLVFAPVDTDKAYSGFAAAVTTPFEFCVLLDDSLLVMNQVSIMLDNLPGQMLPLPEAHLVSGTCCLLKSNTKNKWCRAEIVHSDTTAILNLVDYGHYECMPYQNCSKLKRLPVELTNLPKVTYPCILRGVKPVRADGQWTDEAVIFFQECLYQKNLKIFFREFVSNMHWKVDILADNVHVAKELVDSGHASYTDIMLGLRFQEQSLCMVHGLDDEEGCNQEDEVSDRKSDRNVQSIDEADEEMPPIIVPGSSRCFLM